MPQGLVLYNSGGSVILNVSDRITRFIGSYSYSLSGTSTSVYVPGASADGTWFAFITQSFYHWAVVGQDSVTVYRPTTAAGWGDSGAVVVFRG